MQLAEAQAQRCYLHGDVINQHRMFRKTDDDAEKPQQNTHDTLSVCSCACMDNRTCSGRQFCCCLNRKSTTASGAGATGHRSKPIVKRLVNKRTTSKAKNNSNNNNNIVSNSF